MPSSRWRPPCWTCWTCGTIKVRQYPAKTSPNAALNTPRVKTVTGLGTGGGAAVQTSQTGSGNYGEIFLDVANNRATGGNVVITFPGTPPTLFIAGSEGLGTLSQGTVGNDVTITWTGQPKPYRHRIHYEWFNYLKAN